MATPPYPDIPAVIENDEREYEDSGVPSSVAIAGHPLHPLLVTFPIGFLTGALGSDVGYWLTSDPFWARASLWLIGAGLVTAIVAAVTGMSDFIKIERVRQHTAGWAHMILNVSLLALTIVNFLLRLNDPIKGLMPWGFVLSFIIGTLLGISGWYGAELIYRHKIAVIGNSTNSKP
ncbi:DUF2231 domain-containing protein [Leptolyngbya sp. FACHB-261]|uniref:DUF2231 domain-containing protein n=1 Tax=Leptolyngbya sp. FACHB-261 TaxID=2692806 RepID=UPI00168843BF|nr:DUF2231 domain-containing protein [Leptolyngbya sp. FACHB-261]MBD2102912.1 DUF2231 domain-containing protein [Leptolyngbya sp. FACHB-261]